MIVVYEVYNLKNGKSYIGVAKNGLEDRRRKHLWTVRHGRGYRLAAAIRKYGEENFRFSVICECSSYKEALATEVALIAQLEPEYNVTLGGEGVLGLKMSEETKRKLVAAIKSRPNVWIGRKHTEASKKKIREAKLGSVGHWRGKERGEEFSNKCRERAKKISMPKHTQKHTPEAKAKIKAALARRGYVPPTEAALLARAENFKKCRKAQLVSVRCVDTGQVFDSIKSAADLFGLQGANITSVCRGRYKTTGGKKFEYVECVSW